MRIWIVIAILSLTGCSPSENYQLAPKVTAPIALQGIWQTEGPQKGLISPGARATLMIDPKGNTLDCREWQRVITKFGKLIRVNQQIQNLNQALRSQPLQLKGEVLLYDKLVLHRKVAPSPACNKAALELYHSAR